MKNRMPFVEQYRRALLSFEASPPKARRVMLLANCYAQTKASKAALGSFVRIAMRRCIPKTCR